MVKIIYIISHIKTSHRQRILEASCKMKETVEKYILKLTKNGCEKIMQLAGITSKPTAYVSHTYVCVSGGKKC